MVNSFSNQELFTAQDEQQDGYSVTQDAMSRHSIQDSQEERQLVADLTLPNRVSSRDMTTQAELPMIEEQVDPCLERPDSWSFYRLIRQAV